MNILYQVPLSPFCRKVRLSLAEKKIEVQLVEERYWERDADFLRRNPAGKVPVLKMGGEIFTESSAICELLEERFPEPRLGKALFKKLANGRRFCKDLATHLEHRDFSSWIAAQKIRIPFPIALFHQLYFDFLLCQAQTHFAAEWR